jgi:hypothetical protein
VGAAGITSLTLINTACKNSQRLITAGSAKAMTRVTGRWSDAKGAMRFLAASSPELIYPCQGNFNPGCFSIYMNFLQHGVASNNVRYLFSTTGDVIKIHESAPGVLSFDLNGTVLQADISGYLVQDQWWRLFASYDGANMKFYVKKIGGTVTVGTSGTGPGTPYRGLPTNFYIGTDASSANAGDKYIDEIRFFNYPLNIDVGEELDELHASLGPLPVGRGCMFYLSCDDGPTAVGMDNTTLVITETVAQYSLLDINCETCQVNKLTANFNDTPDNVIDNVSGPFPFLVPGYNGIQVIHNGSASGLNMAIEDKRRFL